MADNGVVEQAGNVTKGHAVVWIAPGVIGDAGNPANGGEVTELGLGKNGGIAFAITNNDPSIGLTQPYSQLGFGINHAEAYITLQGYGETTPAFSIIIDGTAYPFPVSSLVTATRLVTIGTADSATNQDGTIIWNSSTAGAKTQTIFASATDTKGHTLTIVDEAGTASVYPITITPSSGTIGGQASYTMTYNYESTSWRADGAGNWVQV